MEPINFGYSMKNIFIPSQRNYKYNLIEKVESVIKRMRWKALFFDKSSNNDDGPSGFYIKSRKCPKQHNALKNFETDLISIIENVKFRTVRDTFQEKLKTNIKKINNSPNIFVPADK